MLGCELAAPSSHQVLHVAARFGNVDRSLGGRLVFPLPSPLYCLGADDGAFGFYLFQGPIVDSFLDVRVTNNGGSYMSCAPSLLHHSIASVDSVLSSGTPLPGLRGCRRLQGFPLYGGICFTHEAPSLRAAGCIPKVIRVSCSRARLFSAPSALRVRPLKFDVHQSRAHVFE